MDIYKLNDWGIYHMFVVWLRRFFSLKTDLEYVNITNVLQSNKNLFLSVSLKC
jgi:hypothetical protein